MLRVYTQTNLRRDLNLGSPLEIQNSDVNDIVLFTLLTAPGTLSQPVHERCLRFPSLQLASADFSEDIKSKFYG